MLITRCCSERINLLFKNIGIVVAPLHFDVCVVFCSEIFSSLFIMLASDCAADNIGSKGTCSVTAVVLPVFATTPVDDAPPPLRMRRRLVLSGPGKFSDTVVMMMIDR